MSLFTSFFLYNDHISPGPLLICCPLPAALCTVASPLLLSALSSTSCLIFDQKKLKDMEQIKVFFVDKESGSTVCFLAFLLMWFCSSVICFIGPTNIHRNGSARGIIYCRSNQIISESIFITV